MGARIVFGIMSAVAPQPVVEQLVDALGDHTIVIHHDYSQQPEFHIDRPNVRFVPDPVRTGWGCWGHARGMFKALEWAAAHLSFDYFQLLSPSCLPIRPLREFERYVASGEHDANNVSMPLAPDSQQFMHFAYRTLAAKDSLRYRAMRKLRGLYFADRASVEDRANVQIRTDFDGIDRGRPSLTARLARAATRVLAATPSPLPPLGAGFQPRIGDVWFGVTPTVAMYMLERFADPSMQRWFSGLEIPEELLVATILGNSGFRIGPANHFINTYEQSHPRWISLADLPRLRASGKYFARKFPNDPNALVRLHLLDTLRDRSRATAV